MSLRNVLAAGALACAAAATWYWSRPPAPAPAARAANDTAPLGYYLRGARITGTDDDGRITYMLTAEHAEERPAEERLELLGVRIDYRPESEVSWQVRAARAAAPKSGSHLELSGEVELRDEPVDGRPPTVIRAETLRLAPDEYVAETSAPIEVTIGNDVLRAVGLKADLKHDHLQLESEGHGRFVP